MSVYTYIKYLDLDNHNGMIDLTCRLASGEALDSLLIEAFAVVREASWRILELRHYDVQLIGILISSLTLIYTHLKMYSDQFAYYIYISTSLIKNN